MPRVPIHRWNVACNQFMGSSGCAVSQCREQEDKQTITMSMTHPEESRLSGRNDTQPSARPVRSGAPWRSWFVRFSLNCFLLRWWSRPLLQQRLSLRSEILGDLSQLRARLALVRSRAADATALVAASDLLSADPAEALIEVMQLLEDMQRRGSKIARAVAGLEAAADGPALPPIGELRRLLADARLCASQLSLVESALAARPAQLLNPHPSLADAGRAAAPLSAAQA